MKRLDFPRKHKLMPSVRIFLIHQSRIRRPSPTKWHDHTFWQAEFVISGRQQFQAKNAIHTLSRGHMALIPPGVTHKFNYISKMSNTCSIRFSVSRLPESLPPAIIPLDMEAKEVLDLLIRMLTKDQPVPNKKMRIVEHLMAALMDLQYGKANDNEFNSPLVNAVNEHLHTSMGAPVLVTDIAQAIGYSRSRLSERFRAEAGMTLKQFMDKYRIDVAETLLKYSSDSLGSIAASMHFPDLYTFSRFFKRMKGESPRAFRKHVLVRIDHKPSR